MTYQTVRGDQVELVRWRPTEDGWAFDLIEGTYWARNQERIEILLGDKIVPFSRRSWELCSR